MTGRGGSVIDCTDSSNEDVTAEAIKATRCLSSASQAVKVTKTMAAQSDVPAVHGDVCLTMTVNYGTNGLALCLARQLLFVSTDDHMNA